MSNRCLLSLLAMVAFSTAAFGQENAGVEPPTNPPLAAAPLAGSQGNVPVARLGPPRILKPASTTPQQPDGAIQPAVQLGAPVPQRSVAVSNTPVPENGPCVAATTQPLVAFPGTSFNPPPAMPGNSGRFWARAEYGFWSLRGSNLPPLVTTSPAGTGLANAGVLGNPGTAVLIGDQRANGDVRQGGLFTLGGWLNPQQTWGLQGSFWLLGGLQQQGVAASNSSQIIARPFIDALTGAPAAELVSFPGLIAGGASVTARSDALYGGNLLLRNALCVGCYSRLDLLAGYRYLRFDESLQIQESLTSMDPLSLGAKLLVTDHFATRNEFNGGEVGLQAEWWRGRFSLRLLGSLAVGNLHREVQIDGSTVVSVAGFAPVVSPGGLLALSSNSGTFSSDKVVCIPEIGITTGWLITPRLRATVGYSLLYWPGVVRPGDQIDPVINPSLLPPAALAGPARPAFAFHESDLLIQGVRFGLEYRY